MKRRYLTQEEDYNCRFGGLIYPYDFTTNYGRSSNNPSIADRIISDLYFDRELREYGERKLKNNKHGTEDEVLK